MSIISNAPTESRMTDEYVNMDGESYYRISDSHELPDFFMSLVGASDHWMFVSSRGALTAGRRDPDNALFPYAADDQVSLGRAQNGPVTLIRDVKQNWIWEPFADNIDNPAIQRNLYKNPPGNKVIFEECNSDLHIAFRYRWVFSERFGFVRSCTLTDLSGSERQLEVVDGLRNVLPYGVSSDFMMRFSNLGNAYRKCELLPDSNLGLFYLSSIPTDRAEPSEALKTTTVWQTGLTPSAIALSTGQLDSFRSGRNLESEPVVRGVAGAYLVQSHVEIPASGSVSWHVVAELEQDHCDVIALDEQLRTQTAPESALVADVEQCEQRFLQIMGSSDGLQCTENPRRANRHLSNTVFNVMRGGIPLNDYQVSAEDFRSYVADFNSSLLTTHADLLNALPETLDAAELTQQLSAAADPDLTRLSLEYLPLAFSRRHGDPTRPWNRFAIELRSDDGRTNLNYQGNWRDIFQNWEALATSFPRFSLGMICRFANATTMDGYNPYRLTRGGFEWEEPTPEAPWANIGYWGDHQVIYLLKLLEWNQRVDSRGTDALLNSRVFVHADIPYRIRGFDHIRSNPFDTIEFDRAKSELIAARVEAGGADGKLLRDRSDAIHHVPLIEKLLTLTLAKLSNFVPDGGIWLNTQRPEWNDANNALVGNGLSMVTACYLHRWCQFMQSWLAGVSDAAFEVSAEVATLLQDITEILGQYQPPETPHTSEDRGQIVEQLSQAGSRFRHQIYQDGVSGKLSSVTRDDCVALFRSSAAHLSSTIQNNRRSDGLYHSYNLIRFEDSRVEVDTLYEMLEGQVAVLSSGLLSPEEVCDLLDALRNSSLYRQNQDSYLLYPDRRLPGFLAKNNIDPQSVENSPLLQQMIADENRQIVRRDVNGGVHFNGQFRNSADLRAELQNLPACYDESVRQEAGYLVQLFEDLFEHRRFTGRSGTFFAYEGLGSIYWHMVSKLGLAVVENFFGAVDQGAPRDTIDRLRDHFHSVRNGIGAEKSPAEYGAFPSDPYSHTPENSGVKQPGMTGQVKEDLLSRFAEIGAHVENGALRFRFDLFDTDELLTEPRDFTYYNVAGEQQTLQVPRDAFAFTFCQVPVVCQVADADRLVVTRAGGSTMECEGLLLDRSLSESVFARNNDVTLIRCYFRPE